MNKVAIFTSALALALAAPLAQAAIEISYQIDGGAVVPCGFNPVSAGPAVCVTASGPDLLYPRDHRQFQFARNRGSIPAAKRHAAHYDDCGNS